MWFKNIICFQHIRLSTTFLPDPKEALTSKFEEWKGNEEQIDDVLIVGVEIQ